MEKKEILALAKKNYSIGTEIIPFNLEDMIGNIQTTIISEDDHHFHWFNSSKKRSVWVSTGDFCSVIYNEGKWAEIVNR